MIRKETYENHRNPKTYVYVLLIQADLSFQYLYLLFSDDSLISLDEWVYNTEGHPLPIKGVNPYYRAAATAQT